MRGDAPEALLADRPDPVRDVVEKPAVSLRALGDDERFERGASREVLRFVAAAVALARELEEERRRKRGVGEAEELLAVLDELATRVCRQRLPRRAVVGARVGGEARRGDEQGADVVG